jgi:hypothetical protein
MRKIDTAVAIQALLAPFLAIMLPGILCAQTFYGIASGLNYAGPSPSSNPFISEHYTKGLALQLSFGRQIGEQLAVRMDAFLNHFAVQQPPTPIMAMCAYGRTCVQRYRDGFTSPVGIAGFTASMRLTVDPQQTAVKMYVIAGPGAYYVYQNPGAAGAVRPGVSAGGGFSTRVGSRSTVFVEARYHRLLSAPGHPAWLVPLTFGFTL